MAAKPVLAVPTVALMENLVQQVAVVMELAPSEWERVVVPRLEMQVVRGAVRTTAKRFRRCTWARQTDWSSSRNA